ncbi:6-phosphogluconolactonase [Aeromicrobium sp.]|uniref:6-phosphogluconolactonase n=1 Tax=Aeromicrobium sp. TaxID=1871063 RepID=UPI00199AE1BD|nr:6-phosphogluconolactonase [Aeromicrobium sp.]MBC7630769.1 6-phosphogluconolactonase [Aeromicrobium sp.]
MGVDVYPDAPSLAAAIADRIAGRLALVQGEGRRPSIVLTGGTIASAAYALLDTDVVDWADVDYYWGDERFVPEGHADRNDQQARDTFLTRLGVPTARVHTMPGLGGAKDAMEAAEAYADILPDDLFDVVLLGMGPDGHVASLFPGQAQLNETRRRTVEVLHSPKPPSVRLSMTFPTLNHCDSVWFLVSGEEKADAVARALGDGTVEDTPAMGVHGLVETVWLIDNAAGSKLPH